MAGVAAGSISMALLGFFAKKFIFKTAEGEEVKQVVQPKNTKKILVWGSGMMVCQYR